MQMNALFLSYDAVCACLPAAQPDTYLVPEGYGETVYYHFSCMETVGKHIF